MADATFRVTDADGREVQAGDQVMSFRGEAATFVRVTRGTEYNGTAKVSVRWPDGFEHVYYDRVFNLTVSTIKDKPLTAGVPGEIRLAGEDIVNTDIDRSKGSGSARHGEPRQEGSSR